MEDEIIGVNGKQDERDTQRTDSIARMTGRNSVVKQKTNYISQLTHTTISHPVYRLTGVSRLNCSTSLQQSVFTYMHLQPTHLQQRESTLNVLSVLPTPYVYCNIQLN